MANSDDKDDLFLPAHVGKATLPAGLEKGRFPNEKNSTHLIEAEIIVLNKNSPKALYELACKPLNQEARIRSIKKVSDMVSIKLYSYRRFHTNLYRICLAGILTEAILLQSRADVCFKGGDACTNC